MRLIPQNQNANKSVSGSTAGGVELIILKKARMPQLFRNVGFYENASKPCLKNASGSHFPFSLKTMTILSATFCHSAMVSSSYRLLWIYLPQLRAIGLLQVYYTRRYQKTSFPTLSRQELPVYRYHKLSDSLPIL